MPPVGCHCNFVNMNPGDVAVLPPYDILRFGALAATAGYNTTNCRSLTKHTLDPINGQARPRARFKPACITADVVRLKVRRLLDHPPRCWMGYPSVSSFAPCSPGKAKGRVPNWSTTRRQRIGRMSTHRKSSIPRQATAMCTPFHNESSTNTAHGGRGKACTNKPERRNEIWARPLAKRTEIRSKTMETPMRPTKESERTLTPNMRRPRGRPVLGIARF